MALDKERIAVLGLGYVGLPLALALAEEFPGTVGFDVNEKKIAQLKSGEDPTKEAHEESLRNTSLNFSCKLETLKDSTFYIVAVPTPIDENRNPDLKALKSASEIVGKVLSTGAIVVYESTVYPGLTEEICGPILEHVSGLRRGVDFKLGYSPERMNPGDMVHTLANVVKVVSAEDEESLERVANVYGVVVKAGIHKASSIKVAEAAKVIENTQRDLNIALMNELAIIFDRMDISTSDVIAAASTKWNFNRFMPGLVGGHCVGVDPYYLTTKAEQLGYHPQVILAGRRINDDMGRWVAQKTVKLLINAGFAPKGSRVGILGLSFKENVSDMRNSRVPDIYRELLEFGVEPLLHDPMVDPLDAHAEYGVSLVPWDLFKSLDAFILAVPHKIFSDMGISKLLSCLKKGGILIDIKNVLKRNDIPKDYSYWSL